MKKFAALTAALLLLSVFTACAAPEKIPSNDPNASRSRADRAQEEMRDSK